MPRANLSSADHASREVDRYIAAAPREVQSKLQELRTAIRSAAPEAEERISYGIPGYYQNGAVIFFGLWKTHIGLYPVREECAKEFEPYKSSKATARLPLDRKLPIGLIKKLVRARVKTNKALAVAKKASRKPKTT